MIRLIGHQVLNKIMIDYNIYTNETAEIVTLCLMEGDVARVDMQGPGRAY